MTDGDIRTEFQSKVRKYQRTQWSFGRNPRVVLRGLTGRIHHYDYLYVTKSFCVDILGLSWFKDGLSKNDAVAVGEFTHVELYSKCLWPTALISKTYQRSLQRAAMRRRGRALLAFTFDCRYVHPTETLRKFSQEFARGRYIQALNKTNFDWHFVRGEDFAASTQDFRRKLFSGAIRRR
jgi:hypothetical protein